MLSSTAYKPVLDIPDAWKNFCSDFLKQGLGKISADSKHSAVSFSGRDAEDLHGTTIFWAFLFASLLWFNMAKGRKWPKLANFFACGAISKRSTSEWCVQVSAIDFCTFPKAQLQIWGMDE